MCAVGVVTRASIGPVVDVVLPCCSGSLSMASGQSGSHDLGGVLFVYSVTTKESWTIAAGSKQGIFPRGCHVGRVTPGG